MPLFKSGNFALAFVLELAVLAALVLWGFTIDASVAARWVAGVTMPMLALTVWAIWLAPRSPRRLEMPWLMVVKLVVFALASLALTMAGYLIWGALLVVLAVVNLGLAVLWEQDDIV
jgi:hypothetical protein